MPAKNTTISGLLRFLEQDALQPIPKYPSQALYALKNKSVENEIRKRVDKGETIIKIELLPYDTLTGLNRLYFKFKSGSKIALQYSGILVLLNSDLAVKGIIEDFDSDRPNRYLLINPSSENLPFVLAQPSPMRKVTFTTEDLKLREDRTNAFIEAFFPGIIISGDANNERTFSAFPPDTKTSICRWLSYEELTQIPDVRPPFKSNWKGDQHWDSDSDDSLP